MKNHLLRNPMRLRFVTTPEGDTPAGGSAAPAEPTEAATDTTEPAATEASDDLEKWKALARKHEARAAANADKAKRFDELEDANRSEIEKATARAEKAEKELEGIRKAEQTATLRAEVAKAKGVDAALLRGETREELDEHADLLAAALKLPAAPGTGGQGEKGSVHESGDRSAKDIVDAALTRS